MASTSAIRLSPMKTMENSTAQATYARAGFVVEYPYHYCIKG